MIAHGALPKNPIESVGIDLVGIGEIKALRLYRPPCRIMQLRHNRCDCCRGPVGFVISAKP
jgi:hypothetical protein